LAKIFKCSPRDFLPEKPIWLGFLSQLSNLVSLGGQKLFVKQTVGNTNYFYIFVIIKSAWVRNSRLLNHFT
jgi:hypothetical protein